VISVKFPECLMTFDLELDHNVEGNAKWGSVGEEWDIYIIFSWEELHLQTERHRK